MNDLKIDLCIHQLNNKQMNDLKIDLCVHQLNNKENFQI